MYGPHICTIWLLWSHHTFDGIGILWSPYLIWNRYGPPTCEVFSCLIWLMVPHTLYGRGILWIPYMWTVMSNMTLMVPPYLIWNRYHVVHHMSTQSPHMSYMTYGPPYLIWNRYPMVHPYLIWNNYHMVPPHVHMVPHMWSVFMSYMTLMVPIPYME